MTKNLRYFLIALILSLPFWWGINLLEGELNNFFFWREMAGNPKILAAEANQFAFEENLRDLKPLRNNQVADLEIDAQAAISVFLDNEDGERVLFEKDSSRPLPIASLTKLMAAKVVLENYDLTKEITISQEAVEQEEDLGKLKMGKVFPVGYLLYPLLMESSNDAAFALSNDYDGMDREKFVGLMNLNAKDIGLENTYFFNATGLEPDEDKYAKGLNYATAGDLVKLTKGLLNVPLVWEILSTPRYTLYGPELINTNELLGEIPEIIGGKTGYTEKAQGCFLLVLEAPKSKGVLINVILGTGNNRFEEMRKLINWSREAYEW